MTNWSGLATFSNEVLAKDINLKLVFLEAFLFNPVLNLRQQLPPSGSIEGWAATRNPADDRTQPQSSAFTNAENPH